MIITMTIMMTIMIIANDNKHVDHPGTRTIMTIITSVIRLLTFLILSTTNI